MIPLVMLLVPETPAFFQPGVPDGAVDKINRSLKAFAKPPISALPALAAIGGQAQGDRHPGEPAPASGHAAAGVRLHVPHDDLLLHPQVGGADRVRHRLQPARRGERADLGQYRRRDRRRPVRPSCSRNGDIKWPTIVACWCWASVAVAWPSAWATTPCGLALRHLPDDVLPQCRDRRLLRRLRPGLPGLCARDRHRLRAWRRRARRGRLADHRRAFCSRRSATTSC